MKLDDLPGDACEHCGGEMPVGLKVSAKFCSNPCRLASYNRLESLARAEARRGKICTLCGSTFDAKVAFQQYCSLTCRRQAGRAARKLRLHQRTAEGRKNQTCQQCGGTYDALKTLKQRYCSDACRKVVKAARDRRRRMAQRGVSYD